MLIHVLAHRYSNCSFHVLMPFVLVTNNYLIISRPTQSIGLLSYTFLRMTGMEDIVVPMVNFLLFSFSRYSRSIDNVEG